MEQDHDDRRSPVAFISCGLNPQEKIYARHDLALLLIVDTLRTKQFFLHVRTVIVHSGQHPLKYLETQELLTLRQVCWLERLSLYDFDIVPIRGESNQVAAELSRQPSKVRSCAQAQR